MKSQLLQSCQGCVPSTTSPILTFPKGKEKSQNEGPIPTFPKGEGVHHNLLKHKKNEFPPLGEG